MKMKWMYTQLKLIGYTARGVQANQRQQGSESRKQEEWSGIQEATLPTGRPQQWGDGRRKPGEVPGQLSETLIL